MTKRRQAKKNNNPKRCLFFCPPDSNYFLHSNVRSESFGACPATTAGVGKTLSLHFMKGLPPNSSFALRPLPASYLHTVHSAKTRSAIPQQPILISVLKFCNDFPATRKLFQASGCLSLLCIQQLVDRILCARHTISRRYLTVPESGLSYPEEAALPQGLIARECGP